MQKLTLLLILVAAAVTTQAQTEKGKFLVGATSDLSFTNTSFGDDGGSNNNFGLGVNGGYFVLDDFAAGMLFGFSRNSSDNFNSTSTSIGPFLRYFFYDDLFASVAYQHSFIATEFSGDKNSTDGGQLNMQVGYAIFIKDVVAIEPSFNYSIGSGSLLGDVKTFSLNVGFNLYF